MKVSTIEKWPSKKKSVLRRSDSDFTKFIEEEYPGITYPERERRILERLLYGEKKKKQKGKPARRDIHNDSDSRSLCGDFNSL